MKGETEKEGSLTTGDTEMSSKKANQGGVNWVNLDGTLNVNAPGIRNRVAAFFCPLCMDITMPLSP